MNKNTYKFLIIFITLLLFFPIFNEGQTSLFAQELRIEQYSYKKYSSSKKIDVISDKITLPNSSIHSLTIVLIANISINNLRYRISTNKRYTNFKPIGSGNYLYGYRITLELKYLKKSDNLIELNYYTMRNVVRNLRININRN